MGSIKGPLGGGGSWMEPLQKPFEPHAMILISESGRKITLRSLLENVEFREFPTTHVTACVYIYICTLSVYGFISKSLLVCFP